MEQRKFRFLLLKRAIFQKKAKALLILLAIMMGSSVVAALLNLQTDLRSRMNRELRDYGPNVVIVPDPSIGEKYLKESVLKHLLNSPIRNRILSFTPELFIPARVNGQAALLTGADLSSLKKLYPNWKWSGSNSGAVVGEKLRERLGLKNNSTILLKLPAGEDRMQITGFVESGESEDDQVLMDLQTLQALTQQNDFHVITLSVLGEIADVEKDFSTFTSKEKGIHFQLIRKIAAAEMLILDKISRLIGLVISLIFVTLFFCVNTTASTILLSRQGEIALLRVLGARRKQILISLMSELLTLGLVGGILGFALGMIMVQVLGRVLFQSLIAPHFSIFLITIFSSVFMVVISVIVPIRRAVNRQAALVLKEA